MVVQMNEIGNSSKKIARKRTAGSDGGQCARHDEEFDED
jgi:hypothetical protein